MNKPGKEGSGEVLGHCNGEGEDEVLLSLHENDSDGVSAPAELGQFSNLRSDMQRVLSFPPQSSRRFGDPSEFVTKRMCFSFMFSIAFLAILAGFLLGRFVFDQELELSRTKLRKHQQQQSPPRTMYNESIFLREISEQALETHLESLESAGDSGRSYNEAMLIRAALEDGSFDLVSPMMETHLNLSFPDSDRDNLVILVGDGVRLTCNDSRPRIQTTIAQGHRTSSTVRGNIVYVNFGRDEDYHQLDTLGVAVKDAVVLVRVGRSPPADLVTNALEHEAVGILLYRDPQQRDVEDPFPSPADLARINNSAYKTNGEDAVPLVCITSEDAEKVFNQMTTRDASPESWRGDLNSSYPIGPGLRTGHLLVIVNTVTVSRKFYDVSGAIRGTHEPDRFVMVAHERTPGDDPDSTAIVTELIRTMGVLKKTKDWKPHRSIVVASWGTDSRSHSRTKDWWSRLRMTAVAYLKIDSSLLDDASLPARGTPILEKVFRESASTISIGIPMLDVMLQTGTDVHLIESGVPFLQLKRSTNATRRIKDVTSLWASLTWKLAQNGGLPFGLDAYVHFFNHSVHVIRERYKMMSHRRSLFLDSFFEANQRLIQTMVSFQSRQSRDVPVKPIAMRIANDQLLRFANVLSCRKDKQEFEHSFRHAIFSRSTLGPDQSAGFGLLRDLLRETTSTNAPDDLQQQIIAHLADLVKCIDTARFALTDGLENVARSE